MWGKARWELDNRIVKIMGSVVSSYILEFQKYATLREMKQWTRLALGKDKPFTKEVICSRHKHLP